MWVMGYFLVSMFLAKGLGQLYNSTTGEEVCSLSLTCLNRGRCNGERCQCLAGFRGFNCGIAITCAALSSLVQNVVLPSGYSAAFGSLVTYGCLPGYQFLDVSDPGLVYTRMVRCNADGKWGPNLNGCLALCPPVPIWRGYHVSSLDRYSGTSVLYNCSGIIPIWMERVGEERYQFADGGSGMRMAICSDEGVWMPALTECLDKGHDEVVAASLSIELHSRIYLFRMLVLLAMFA